MLQGFVPNQGDGWTLTLEELARYYENCATVAFPEGGSAGAADLIDLAEQEPSQLARDHVGIALESAARLGRRTAELHLALASAGQRSGIHARSRYPPAMCRLCWPVFATRLPVSSIY